MPSDDRLGPMVRKLERWEPFDEEDRQSLLSLPHAVKSADRHGYLVRENDHPTHSCLLLEGFAFRHKIVADGRRQIVALHMPGDLVDLQNALLRVADNSVQALTAVEVAFIPHSAIIHLAFERPRIGKALWHDTLVEGSIAQEWIANVGRRTAFQGIAHLLCEFAVRLEAAGLGERLSYELPMTQEQLADATGLTAVHVNRTLQLMDERGLVTRTRRAVIINDWHVLANAGDFDSAYLHLGDRSSLN